MTTVENVLIYEALERDRAYREEKKKKKLSDKVKVKIEKWKLLQDRMKAKALINKQKSKVSSLSKVANKTKKLSQWVKIGKRRNTGEKEVFEEIRNERPHICTICKKYITEAQARCFAHLLAKGMYPKYRLNKHNIAVVCWPDCHKAVDSIMVWNNKRVVQLLLYTWTDFYYIMDIIWRPLKHATDEPWQSQLSGEW